MNTNIDAWVKESPYKLTAEEKTLIKRKLRTLNCEMYTLKVSATKRKFTVKVIVNDTNMVCIDSTRRKREKYGIHANPQLNDEIRDLVKSKIDAIVTPHQKCYSEADTMTDYFGSYRIDYYWVTFELSAQVVAEVNARGAA